MVRRLAIVGATLALGGCFTTTSDFKKDAERFILENEDLASALDVGFASATCQQPPRQDVGTEFPCTAIDDQGRSWEFTVKITGTNEYEVNVSQYP